MKEKIPHWDKGCKCRMCKLLGGCRIHEEAEKALIIALERYQQKCTKRRYDAIERVIAKHYMKK